MLSVSDDLIQVYCIFGLVILVLGKMMNEQLPHLYWFLMNLSGVMERMSKFVETFYVNVLGQNYDKEKYNYWLANLNNGIETRYELLSCFSESKENNYFFTK